MTARFKRTRKPRGPWQDPQSQMRRLEGSVQAILAFWLHRDKILEGLGPAIEAIDPRDCLNEGLIIETCMALVHREGVAKRFWDACVADDCMAFVLGAACASWRDHHSVGGKVTDVQQLIAMNRSEVELYVKGVVVNEVRDVMEESGFLERHKSVIHKERRDRKTVERIMDR